MRLPLAPRTLARPLELQSCDSCNVRALFYVDLVDARDQLVLPDRSPRLCTPPPPASREHTIGAESERSCNLVSRVVLN